MTPWLPPALAVLLVTLGGGVGAVLRHCASTSARGPVRGVLMVNLLGATALGSLVAMGSLLPGWLFLLLGTGLCGALTTWSTLAVQTWELGRLSWGRAAAYLGISVVLGIAAAALGYALTTALS